MFEVHYLEDLSANGGGGGTEPDVREIKASSPGGTQEKLFLLAREISNILFILYRLKKSSENKEN